jgi:hypothetical protein
MYRQTGFTPALTETGSCPDDDRLHAAILELRRKQIFFIGGTPKSGTTWVQLLLNAHPDISCDGEGHFVDKLAPLLDGALARHCGLISKMKLFRETGGYPVLEQQEFRYILASCICLFMLKQSVRKNVQAVGEKTPDNVRHFRELATLFPAARFIHVVRDGRDCAVSAWHYNERIRPGWQRDQGTLERFACVVAEQWAADLDLARSFCLRHPDRFYQVRYEDLISDTVANLSRVCEFLGVASSKSLLQQCAHVASFSSLTGGRDRGNENRSSFFRKAVPGDWHVSLSDRAVAEFRNRAGSWLDRLGYA